MRFDPELERKKALMQANINSGGLFSKQKQMDRDGDVIRQLMKTFDGVQQSLKSVASGDATISYGPSTLSPKSPVPAQPKAAPQPGKITQITAAEPNSYGIPVAGEPTPVGRAPDDFCQNLWNRLSGQQPGSPEYLSTVSEIDKYCGLPPGAKPPPPKPKETDACLEARGKFSNYGLTGFGNQYEAARLMHDAKRKCRGPQ